MDGQLRMTDQRRKKVPPPQRMERYPCLPEFGHFLLEHSPSECASGEHAQEAASENERAHFDMMSIAPNFDLLIEACTAEEIAKTIVRSDIG